MTNELVRFGEHNGPALVVAGSIGSDARLWRTQLDAWANRYRVYFYQYPGHGTRAVTSKMPDSLQAFAQDLVAAVDALELDRFSFVGLSLGGMIGLELAASQAQRLDKLVACCCRFEQSPELADAWSQRIALVERTGMAAIVQATLERWLTPLFHQTQRARAQEIAAMLLRTDPAGWVAGATAVRDARLTGRIPHLGAAALAISGAQDAAAPPAHIADLADLLGCAHREIPDAAHLPNVEHPRAFDAALQGVLA